MLHLLLILSIVPISVSQSSECGSLITYRQFDDLLGSAPECLRAGCNVDTTSFSMSSPCPSTSPCHALWDLLKQEWQKDWCETCSQDIACRTIGWPILNGTSACARSPHEWLFSNSAGGCCANNDEPFDLAAWTGRMCNGSEWRQPFEFYGGMAREDWIEWMQPWNWTVHQQNETDRNFTQVVCESAKSMQVAFLVDNIISAASAAVELFVYWICCICAWQVVMKDVGTWRRSLAAGLVTGGLYLVSNFATSILWDLTPGYQQLPRGYVGLLLCARPSILGFLSLAAIFGRGRVERSITEEQDRERLRMHSGDAGRPREEPWFDSPRVKRWRREFGGFLRKFSFGNAAQNQEVTDQELADGKLTAQQLLTGFALTIGVSELVLQVSSVYSIWKTATMGGNKGFYSRYALLPFYGGSAAARMYGGALIHCVFLFPSTFGLVGIAWSHAKDQQYQTVRRLIFAEERRLFDLRTYYEKCRKRAPGYELTDKDRAEARAMYREQRLLDSSVSGTARPKLWKRTWVRTQEWFSDVSRRLWSPRNPQPGPPSASRTWLPAERGALSTKFHDALVNTTVKVMTPLSRLADSAAEPSQEPGSEASPGHLGAIKTLTKHLVRFVRRLPGRTLATAPLRTRINDSLDWATREQQKRATEIAREEKGPDESRFNEIVQQIMDNRDAARRRAESSRIPTRRSVIFFITGTFVTINYISQWLFWSGYVETAGERCVLRLHSRRLLFLF
ncbi:hypothetical protein OQA88_11122 [Cercophora sp. LCS_1]